MESDSTEIYELAKAFMEKHAIDGHYISLSHARESCRYHAAEIHNIAAVVGGIASQEATKVNQMGLTPYPHEARC